MVINIFGLFYFKEKLIDLVFLILNSYYISDQIWCLISFKFVFLYLISFCLWWMEINEPAARTRWCRCGPAGASGPQGCIKGSAACRCRPAPECATDRHQGAAERRRCSDQDSTGRRAGERGVKDQWLSSWLIDHFGSTAFIFFSSLVCLSLISWLDYILINLWHHIAAVDQTLISVIDYMIAYYLVDRIINKDVWVKTLYL